VNRQRGLFRFGVKESPHPLQASTISVAAALLRGWHGRCGVFRTNCEEAAAMLAIVVVMPLVLYAPVFDSAQSSCGVAPVTATAEESAIVDEFNRRIDAYMKIHNDVERRMAPQWVFEDPEDLLGAMGAMQSGIRSARPAARRGEVFTPDVSALIRTRLLQRLVVCDYSIEDVLGFINEERLPGVQAPRINEPYPWMAGSAMWPTLIAALPPLPSELQYRFFDRDLVVIDVHADLVVDVLQNALPASPQPRRRGRFT
jgi:hypothetical protein